MNYLASLLILLPTAPVFVHFFTFCPRLFSICNRGHPVAACYLHRRKGCRGRDTGYEQILYVCCNVISFFSPYFPSLAVLFLWISCYFLLASLLKEMWYSRCRMHANMYVWCFAVILCFPSLFWLIWTNEWNLRILLKKKTVSFNMPSCSSICCLSDEPPFPLLNLLLLVLALGLFFTFCRSFYLSFIPFHYY